jgi:nucleotide-binding universal stress UspA family protein
VTTVAIKKIIVGYDGSAGARRAADWALQEAARTGAPVEFCYAHARRAGMTPAAEQETVEDLIEDIAAIAAVGHPGIDVRTVIERGPAAAALADRSADASLIVLGSRAGPVATGPLGAVTAEVSAAAQCDVVVVRGRPSAYDPIIVGVDDSDGGRNALTFGFQQAATHKLRLRVIRAWLPHRGGPAEAAGEQVAAAEWRSLTELVDRCRDRFPGVKATHEVAIGHPARVLSEASTQAQLVVVGTRGPRAFRGTVLGSVSRHLLHHAESSVAVVRGDDHFDWIRLEAPRR